MKTNNDKAHEELGCCEDRTCQECCEHNEFDHYICLDCGYEKDPGEDIDNAIDYFEDR